MKSAKMIARGWGLWMALLVLTIGSGCAAWRERVSGESWTQRAAQEDQGLQPGAPW